MVSAHRTGARESDTRSHRRTALSARRERFGAKNEPDSGHGTIVGVSSDVPTTFDPGASRLLSSREPGVRYRTRLDVLGEEPDSPDMVELAGMVASGPAVSALLRFESCPVYQKWRGDHWRLVALVELGLPAGNGAAELALDRVLDAWASEAITRPHVVDGLVREHASVFGNGLAVAARLGAAHDDRAARIAEALCEWQWPDGGWNCDNRATGRTSSVHESLATAWGLAEYSRALGEPRAGEAARAAAEFFLSLRLFRSRRTGEVIDDCLLHFHWPPYWHFDVLQGLRVLAAIGDSIRDPGCGDALELVRRKRQADAMWRADARWWRTAGTHDYDQHLVHGPDPEDGPGVDAVDWGEVEDEMLTLNALIALTSFGSSA